jgi:ribosomal protein L11 methyltransferase
MLGNRQPFRNCLCVPSIVRLRLLEPRTIEAATALLVDIGALELDFDAGELIALVPHEPAEAARVAVERALAELAHELVAAEPAETVDWGSRWRGAVRPIDIGPLCITPPGHAASTRAQYVLEVASQGAFGSGAHETTALCLERIVELSPIGSILDVGTGSGILALAALVLGAEHAVATDDDPAALARARENAQRNHLLDRMTLTDAAPDALHAQFDVVVANILPSALLALAPSLVRRLGHRGVLVLSGLREDDADEVARAYTHFGLHMRPGASRAGWLRLELGAPW